MFLVILILVGLLGTTIFTYITKRSIVPLSFIAFHASQLFKHKLFTVLLFLFVAVHLWGHFYFGMVRYNTSNFDVLTHFLFGLFAIGALERAQIIKEGPKKLILLSFLAFSLCLAQDLTEELCDITTILGPFQGHTETLNQVRDLGLNLLGILAYLGIPKLSGFFKVKI